jgi:hypothetical protein
MDGFWWKGGKQPVQMDNFRKIHGVPHDFGNQMNQALGGEDHPLGEIRLQEPW